MVAPSSQSPNVAARRRKAREGQATWQSSHQLLVPWSLRTGLPRDPFDTLEHMKSQSLPMLALATVVACKSVATPQPRDHSGAPSPAANTATTANAVGSVALDSTGAPLPRLKPVTGKPFPEGTTEAMICEAINVKEPDLWLRFGHMIPMYTRGTVLVLPAGKAREADIAAFANWYERKFEPILASCGDKTLIHLEGFDYEEVSAMLTELEERLDMKILERFELPVDGRQKERLSDYCRTDAVLCNDLRNLYYGSRGNGVCAWAIADCSFEYDSKEYVEAVALCVTQPPEQVVCASILGTPSENSVCRKRIQQLYCAEFPIGRPP